MTTPSIGRIVHYTLSEQDAAQVNKRRGDSFNHLAEHRENSNGVQIHVGNAVKEGDVYPLLIVQVWPNDTHGVNGQVFLDGNDTLWATSVAEGDGPRTWSWPPRA